MRRLLYLILWEHIVICGERLGRPPKPKTAKIDLTTVQLSTTTRDRLYRLKFRKTYDEFLNDLCDRYESGLSN